MQDNTSTPQSMGLLQDLNLPAPGKLEKTFAIDTSWYPEVGLMEKQLAEVYAELRLLDAALHATPPPDEADLPLYAERFDALKAAAAWLPGAIARAKARRPTTSGFHTSRIENFRL